MKYEVMFYSGILGSIIMLVFTIVIFIRNNIAEVIRDLTGMNFKKSNKQDKSGTNEVKSKTTNDIRIKTIDKETDVIGEKSKTERLAVEQTELIDSSETMIINEVYQEETSLLLSESESEETTILSQEIEEELKVGKSDFIKEMDIMVVNSDLII